MPKEDNPRKNLTFEQAEGAVPVPVQLQLKEVSPELRALLWNRFYRRLNAATKSDVMGEVPSWLENPWQQILRDMHVYRDHQMVDDFNNRSSVQIERVRSIFEKGDYLAVFGTIQWILRHPACPSDLSDEISSVLKYCRAAYGIVDKNTIVPHASEAERQTVERAFADLSVKEFQGARAHLKQAATSISGGDFAGGVRESIQAVESVVRILEPNANTLSPALAKLETKVGIHGALKAGFSNLYGFTSDEEGIRHALLEKDKAAVDQTDALYMLGACAAFVSYLISKARAVGLISWR